MCSEEKRSSKPTMPDVNRTEEPAIQHPSKTIRRRKIKPDDLPNRPLSAYNIFFKETRRKILLSKHKDHGGVNVPEGQSMVKHIAELWKTVDPTERGRVEKMAEEDRERYRRQVKDLKLERKRCAQEERAKKKLKMKGPVETDSQDSPSPVVSPRGSAPDSPSPPSADKFNDDTKDTLQKDQQKPPNDGIDEEIESLLAAEARAMEVVRSSKLRQMKLVRQRLAACPRMAESLDTRRLALGLCPLLQSAKPEEHPNSAGSSESTNRPERSNSSGNSGTTDLMSPYLPVPIVTAFGGILTAEHTLPPTQGALSRLDALCMEEERARFMLQEHERHNIHHGQNPFYRRMISDTAMLLEGRTVLGRGALLGDPLNSSLIGRRADFELNHPFRTIAPLSNRGLHQNSTAVRPDREEKSCGPVPHGC